MSLSIREATTEDLPLILATFHRVLEEGQTYSYTPEEMTEARSCDYWFGEGHHPFVAMLDGEPAGFYAIRPNRTGRGKHVANASFIVCHDHRRRGVATAMGKHAIATAKELGYQAMQYNFVVSTNEVAVKLWQSLGFEIVGRLPKGFNHISKGLVDVLILHRFL